MNIGERIKNRRIELGLSVDELAKRIGKNRATVYRYESSDIENLPTSILEPLAKALSTTPAYLIGWDKEPPKEPKNQKENHSPELQPIDYNPTHKIPVLGRKGKYVSNKAPYGYEQVKLQGDKGFTLRPVPEQAETVKSIFEWYTNGITRADGTKTPIGTSLIARELNKRRVSSHSGGVWTQQTIRDMLINPVYVGMIRWNWRPVRKKMDGGKVVAERPRSSGFLLCKGLHPPIISRETFEAAAAKMNKNKSRPVRGDKKNTESPCRTCPLYRLRKKASAQTELKNSRPADMPRPHLR